MSEPGSSDAPILRLDGYEGPLDLLLDLARAQKVDLAAISVLSLVEQYLAVVETIRETRLERAADWLVMAAWLTWLKSRLLLPEDQEAAEDAGSAAESLQDRLAELAVIGEAARWLQARPQLGRDLFARGTAEDLREIDRSGLLLDIGQLMGGYMACIRRTARRVVYRPRQLDFWTVQDALDRLRVMIGAEATDWFDLARFLPDPSDGTNVPSRWRARAALAGTLVAGLELARTGAVELRQDSAFGPVLLRRAEA